MHGFERYSIKSARGGFDPRAELFIKFVVDKIRRCFASERMQMSIRKSGLPIC